MIYRRADDLGPKLGLDRRAFLASSAGIAASLWAVNMVACGDDGGGGSGSGSASMGTEGTGGPGSGPTGSATDGSGATSNGYDLGDDETGMDTTGSGPCTPLEGEFIFDVQTHHINPEGSWRETNPGYADFFFGQEQANCGDGALECFSADHYIDLMFLDSDTHVAVLSGIPASVCGDEPPGSPCGNPLTNDEIVQTRELVNMLANSQRSVNHCMITPNVNLPAQLDIMQMIVESFGVGGWKCYPPWGPTGTGWYLDSSDVGVPFISQGLELGVDVFCVHKGLPLPGFDATHTNPRDVGPIAAMFPAAKFVIYHSAWLHGGFGNGEGPYDPLGQIDPSNPVLFPVTQGINSLIQSVKDAGLGTGSNVYAELGSVWTNLIAFPDQLAHILGKLLLHLGEDNVIWGTDCIWTGSPQPLIESFRAFQISEQFQQTYGYPALTDEIKLKVLGRNAAAVFGIDPDATLCEVMLGKMARRRRELDGEFGGRRWTQRPVAGPRTRREFVNFARLHPGP